MEEVLIKELEAKISSIRSSKLGDYEEGMIDGLLIAIRTIEG